MIDVGWTHHGVTGSVYWPLIGQHPDIPASHWSKIEWVCFETWLNSFNVKSCNYTSKRNWQELISARAIINRLGTHFLAPTDNGELGLLFHELIMIRMLSDSIDSGQYRDNEDFWREGTRGGLQARTREEEWWCRFGFACNALMPFSNQ